MIRLHRHALSGHSHRVELMLGLLGLPHEIVEVDLAAGAHKTPAFMALSPLGQVPIIEDGSLTLWDSNAILVYLAERHDPAHRWLPRDAVGAARVQQFLSIAAGPLAAGPAAARVAIVFGAPIDLPAAQGRARALLDMLEKHLTGRDFLAAEAPTLADVALYSYVAHAPEGGVPLTPYPAVRGWLARVEALPGYVPMRRSPIPNAA